MEGGAYGSLGTAWHGLGKFETAISHHEQRLSIAKELGDKRTEGMAYGSLGNAYRSLGNF